MNSKEYNHNYYLRNSERIRKNALKRYYSDTGKFKKQNKEWKKANPERVRELRRVRWLKTTNPTIRGRYKK